MCLARKRGLVIREPANASAISLPLRRSVATEGATGEGADAGTETGSEGSVTATESEEDVEASRAISRWTVLLLTFTPASAKAWRIASKV